MTPLPPQMPGGDDPLTRALAEATAREVAEQQLRMMLQQTIQQPHTSERIDANLAVLVQDGPDHVLLVATPDGRRRDIRLSPQALASIERAAAGQRAAAESSGVQETETAS